MGYFKIVPARGGGFIAHFYGANHELVWFTEIYKFRQGAQHAIDLIRGAGSAPLR
jgi:uncharacterized protein YegP (UPF0339 family)